MWHLIRTQESGKVVEKVVLSFFRENDKFCREENGETLMQVWKVQYMKADSQWVTKRRNLCHQHLDLGLIWTIHDWCFNIIYFGSRCGIKKSENCPLGTPNIKKEIKYYILLNTWCGIFAWTKLLQRFWCGSYDFILVWSLLYGY